MPKAQTLTLAHFTLPARTAWQAGRHFLQSCRRPNLYDSSDGSRITRNSGFSIRTVDGDFGWIGYWGLWVPPEVAINSGDTVTRDTHGGGSGESYSVVKAPGKLIKHTKVEKALGDLKNTPLDYWDDNTGNRYQVFWDGTNKVFEKKFIWGGTAFSWQSYGPETMAFSPNDWVLGSGRMLSVEVSHSFILKQEVQQTLHLSPSIKRSL